MNERPAALWRDPALLSLVLIQIVVGSGFALLIPALPEYVTQLGGSSTELGIFNSSYALALFVFAPAWGWASDRVGRRFALIGGTVGLGVSYALLAVAPSLPIAIVLRAMGGAFAAATIPASFAYVADVTAPEQRGRAMGMVSAGLGLAFVFSPVLGGMLAAVDLIVPFLLAAASSGVAAVLVARFLRPVPPRAPAARGGDALPAGRWHLFAPLLPMLVVSFIIGVADGTRPTALALYADDHLGFGTAELGIVFSVMGIAFVISNWLVVGPAIGRFGERATVLAGLPIGIVGFLLVPLAQDLLMLCVAIGVQGVALAFGFTAIPAYLSRVALGGQGVAMGWRSATVSGGQILGPLLGGGLYAMGALLPFFAGAGIVAVALAVGLYAVRPETTPTGAAEGTSTILARSEGGRT